MRARRICFWKGNDFSLVSDKRKLAQSLELFLEVDRCCLCQGSLVPISVTAEKIK